MTPLIGACGSVKAFQADAAADSDTPPADAWQSSCVPVAVITRVEGSSPFYGNDCIHGGWKLQSRNGTTVPATPIPDSQVVVAPVPIALGSNPLDPGSTFAVHVSGSGQGGVGSYAWVAAELNAPSASQVGTVDASQYTGVQFYAIVSSSAGAWLTVANLYTDPLGQRCTSTPGPTRCYDHPNAPLTPSTEWTRYQIPFASLTQFASGNPSPLGDAFPKDAIIYLQWLIGTSDSGSTPAWELWIDDVTFY